MERPSRPASNAAASAAATSRVSRWIPPGIATFFSLHKAGPRWPIACRAAFSIGLLVMIGWLSGHMSAGLTATIGAFTSLYASERPYRNRARLLAAIALSFAVVVSLGIGAQQLRVPFIAVPLVIVIATFATFVCHVIKLGPPGAYMFALACAAGTSMPGADHAFYHAGLLVLAGGAVSWVVHMAGALVSPRGPERAAVIAAAEAVARFAAINTADALHAKQQARDAAAASLHQAWATLVSYQSSDADRDPTLARLLAFNRELHLLFAACVTAVDARTPSQTDFAERARRIAERAALSAEHSTWTPSSDPAPLGRLDTFDLLRDALRSGSLASLVAARVAIAVAVAGAGGALFGVERAYWAMAAAVLVLHQGLDWERTVRRGVERTLGTLAGLCVASVIFALHPQGAWLALTLMCLQFAVEMLVTRSYALAVVFVTSIALLIASGGERVSAPGALLWARGLDTAIGCGIGLLVFAWFKRRGSPMPIRAQLLRTLIEVQSVLGHLASGHVTTAAALQARRDLQHRMFALSASYDAEAGGLGNHRVLAARLRPTVDVTQRFGYKVLAACWMAQATPAERAALNTQMKPAADHLAQVAATLRALTAAIGDGGAYVPPLRNAPGLLRGELDELTDQLRALFEPAACGDVDSHHRAADRPR